MTTSTLPADFVYDPYAWAVHDDPYPYYKMLRDHAPVYRNEQNGFWFLSRYDDVAAAFRDFATFSNSEGVALESDANMHLGYPMILTMDPPRHTKGRKVVQGMLTPVSIAKLEASIRAKAIKLLEPHLAEGRIDMLADFAAYLPMAVIARMIKVPESDEDMVRVWTDLLVSRADGNTKISREGVEAYFNLAQYMDDLLKHYWEDDQDDSLISAVIRATKSNLLTNDEAIGFMMLLGVAGNETTTKLIGNMTYRLWQHPDQRQLLLDDPKLIGSAIEETLRFDGSTQMLGRKVMKEVTLHGVTIPEGARLGLLTIAASRDERKFKNPDVYDITRDARGHLGFGFGIHACVGAALARLETRVAFEELLPRLGKYEIDINSAKRMHSPNVRGFTHLPTTFK